MNRRQILSVTVCVRSPFSFADVDGTAIGIDTPALRDHDNTPLMPSSHIKGLLREGFRALAGAAPSTLGKLSPAQSADSLFGLAARDYAPQRGTLLFSDLRQQGDAGTARSITRIKIDSSTGTVEDGALAVVELTAPLGAETVFEGEIVWHGLKREAEELAAVLTKALKLVPFFGGMRSAGFGEHVFNKSSVSWSHEEAIESDKAIPAAQSYSIIGTFDRPIAVDVNQIADNVFLGGTVVPGAAIKGALADLLAREQGVKSPEDLPPDMQECLSRLTIGHAYPVMKHASGDTLGNLPLPLSFALFEKTLYRNELDQLGQEPGYHAVHGTGRFIPDMKPSEIVGLAKAVSRPACDFSHFALGHTRIASEAGIAEDQNLFVVIARSVGDVPFRFTVTLPDEEEFQDCAQRMLRVLAGGLDSIGKTRARFKSEDVAARNDVDSVPFTQESPIRVLLETPSPCVIPDPALGETLATLLPKYFKDVDPALELVDCYLQQDIRGGYVSRRSRGAYLPLRVVRAGACFQFANTSAARAALTHLAQTGLPVRRQTGADAFAPVTSWRDCLYVPENGYGRIAVEPAILRLTEVSHG